MSNPPKSYRAQQHINSTAPTDDDDVFNARPSPVPSKYRSSQSSDWSSPPSSTGSTPSLTSGSSGSSSRSLRSPPPSSPLTERSQRLHQAGHPYLTKAPTRLHLLTVPAAPDTEPPRVPTDARHTARSTTIPTRNPRAASVASEPVFQGKKISRAPSPAHSDPAPFAPAPAFLPPSRRAHDPQQPGRQHPGTAAHSMNGSASGPDHNRAHQDDRGAGSNTPAPSPPGGSVHGRTGLGNDGDNGGDEDMGGDGVGDDGVGDGGVGDGGVGDGGVGDNDLEDPDYGGIGAAYNDARNLGKLERKGAQHAYRQHDLSRVFNQEIFPYFLGRCAPCAVRGLEHDHALDDCQIGTGCSDKDAAYGAWHHNAFDLPHKKWCTFCVMALASGGGWHPPGFGVLCPYAQILKPALYALFTNPAPAPHIATSDLIPATLFQDPVPGLYALRQWAQTPVDAHPGLLNLHVLLLWVFDYVGISQIPASCRPLVTELEARTAQHSPATA